MSYLVTIRINNLRELANLPDEFNMLRVSEEGAAAPTSNRWSSEMQVEVQVPDVPYTGVYQDEIDWFLEHHAGSVMLYGQVSAKLQEQFPGNIKVAQVRATLKNRKLLERV